MSCSQPAPPLAARWRRLLATSLAALMALSGSTLPAQAQVRLPSLGEGASADMSISDERRIGDSIMREARRDPALLDDPVLQDYLLSIFNPLTDAARKLGHIDADTDQAFAWEIFLVRDRTVNAFAMPGGYMGVHLGLIAITTTRDQLASVLAHELTHVTQRHIARGIAPSQRASMLAIATLILGAIAASKSRNADVFNAAVMGGQGAGIQMMLNYTRAHEREADRIGFNLLEAAGFAPVGMTAMFEKMDVASRLNDAGGYPYLRSHPLTTDRIAEARNRILLEPGVPSNPALLHALMQIRARVLMAESAQTLQELAGGGTTPLRAERVATLYGGALAASLLNEHSRAVAHANEAVRLESTISPREPGASTALRLLQAQVLLAAGQAAAALQALDALPPSPGLQRAPLLLRAEAALALRSAGEPSPVASGATGVPDDVGLRASTEALQTWVADHPQDAAAWDLLARTSDGLGLKLRSMRAAAEARGALGDLNGAIDRLRAAQGQARSATGQDFIEASVIDSRLRQFSGQRRQLMMEARGEGRGRSPDDAGPN